MGDSYADARHGATRVDTLGSDFTMNVAADTRRMQWSPPQNEKNATMRAVVRRVSVIVLTAGTLTGTTINVFNGTTSIGSVNAGTFAINTLQASAALNTTVSTGDVINLRNSGSDATGVWIPRIEWTEQFSA